MHKDSLDDYMDIGGTTPWMGKVELCLEQQSRTMPGAIVEQSMPSIQSIQGFCIFRLDTGIRQYDGNCFVYSVILTSEFCLLTSVF